LEQLDADFFQLLEFTMKISPPMRWCGEPDASAMQGICRAKTEISAVNLCKTRDSEFERTASAT
jgi:hypothetical protein